MTNSKRKQSPKRKMTRRTRSSRKVCMQAEQSGPKKSPRSELNEDELPAEERACAKQKQAPKKKSAKQARPKRKECIPEELHGPKKSPRSKVNEEEPPAPERACSDESSEESSEKSSVVSDRKTGDTTAVQQEVADLNGGMEEARYNIILKSFLAGKYGGWIGGFPSEWSKHFSALADWTSGFPRAHGIDMEDFNKLSKKDRQEILESVKEYVIQGDVDEVAARFADTDNPFSQVLLAAFLSKYILQTFWGDDGRFWWLEPDSRAKDAKTVPSEFGRQLNRLYEEFIKVHKHLAYAWAMMTTRLSTVTNGLRGDDFIFGRCMKERRRSLVQSIICPELLAKKTMQLLLKDAKSSAVMEELRKMLEKQAENAVLMYSYPFPVRFEGIERMPTSYLDLPESTREEYKDYFKGGDDSPLHGKEVLAITQPASYQQGVLSTPSGEKLISPGQFIINWNYCDGRD